MLGLNIFCKQWQDRKLLVIYAVKISVGVCVIFVSFVNKGRCNCFVVVVLNALY